MRYLFVFALFLSISICNSCGEAGQKKSADSTVTATDTAKSGDLAHSSMNALDWAGVYRGNLPCADCAGVAVALTLQKDLSFSSTSKYVGKSTPDLIEKGTFTWDASGTKITLHPEQGTPSQYLVGENKIIQLDAAGNQLTGPMADRFVLERQTAATSSADILAHGNAKLFETYWKLVEVRGKPVPPPRQGRREPHLVLKEKDSTLNGFGGCNPLTGKFLLQEGNRIRFSGVISTPITCLNQTVEDEFKKALQQSDNYNIQGDTLSMNKSKMAPLARFTAIYKH